MKNAEKLASQLQSRYGRKKSLYFLVEGERACFEIINFHYQEIVKVICISSFFEKLPIFLEVEIVEPLFFDKYSLTDSPQGIMLIMRKKKLTTPKYIGKFQVVLDRIQDPGNMGTILRTCLAVGVKEVILTKGCVDLYNPKMLRASLGANFALVISLVDSLKEAIELKNNGDVWLTTPHKGVSCFSKNFNLNNSLLVFGNEANGINNLSRGKFLRIPMCGNVESLNVAQASTVILFEGVRKLGFFDQ